MVIIVMVELAELLTRLIIIKFLIQLALVVVVVVVVHGIGISGLMFLALVGQVAE